MISKDHVAGVVRVVQEGGAHGTSFHKAWAGACKCGWQGPDRQTFDEAVDDVHDHMIDASDPGGAMPVT